MIAIDHGCSTGDRHVVQLRRADRVFATLYCGDSHEIRPTLGWFDADVMDPPYLFDNSGGGQFRKSRPGSNLIVEEGLDQGFDHAIINPLLCGAAVVFCHNDQLVDLGAHLKGSFERFVVNIWIKPNPMPVRNKHYLPDTEPYFHAWSKGYHPIGEHHDMHRWVTAASVPTRAFAHATVKPHTVMDKIITNVSGRTVCDPFMGTGSTGVAAVRAGKSFTGIEQNPRHFETAVTRITAAIEQLLNG